MLKLNNTKINAVFFDLDGTVLDTAQDLLTALNYVLQDHGLDAIELQQLLPNISYGSRRIITNILNKEVTDTEIEEYKIQFIEAYHKLGHLHADFFPGFKNIISLLNSKNIPWGIITNKTISLTMPVAELFKFHELKCQTVVCADTTAHAKPHPDPMKKACLDLSVDPQTCVFIGDARTDIEAGKAVGMQTVTAGYGYVPHDCELSTWQADFLVHSVAELYHLFESNMI